METERLARETVKLLYEMHGAPLIAYACSRGLDFASAEDIVQQLFLKLLGGHAVPTHSLLAYLYRAVRNASLNLGRDRGHEVELHEEELWLTHATTSCAKTLSVQDALRDLPEEQRETVFLKIWSGLNLQEIADATNLDSPALERRQTPLRIFTWLRRHAQNPTEPKFGVHVMC